MSTPEIAAPGAPTRVRYGVLALLCAVAMITYIQRQSFGVVDKEIREELQISLDAQGLLHGSLFLTYALFQVPGGRLAQFWGTRIALSIYSVVCSTATGLLAVAGGFSGIFAARMGMGLGQAGVFPGTTTTVKAWFPISRLAFANGSITAFMQVGAIFAALCTSRLAPLLGWRLTLGLYAIPGLLWSIWFFAWFRDRPQMHAGVNAQELALLGNSPDSGDEPESTLEAIPWGTILTSRALIFICAQQFFRAAGYAFYATWFMTYLRDGRGITQIAEAGLLTTLPLAGTAIGSLFGGYLSDHILTRTGSRRLARQWLSVASQLACALIVLAAYPVHHAWLAVAIITIGSFCAAIGGPVAYTVTIDMGGRHVPTVFGMMNMCGNLGSFVFPVVVPKVVQFGGVTNWDNVLFLFAGIYVAAAACWLPFNPEGTIFDQPERIR